MGGECWDPIYCVRPKRGPGYPTSCVMVFIFAFSVLRCSFC